MVVYKEKQVIFGQHDEDTLKQFNICSEEAVKAVLCADGHQGYSQPIGSAIAYKDKISVSGVGYDIGCGNTAFKTKLKYSDIKDKIPYIADAIREKIGFGVGVNAPESFPRPKHLFNDPAWDLPFLKDLKDKAIAQFGSIGSGNHYINIYRDTEDSIWIGCHFGSRGLGHSIASHFLQNTDKSFFATPVLLDIHSEEGQNYLTAMNLARRYARLNRQHVLIAIFAILQTACDSYYIENNHNDANFEEVDGNYLWVVRKGCTPLRPEQLSFIGGSMGDNSYIIKGKYTQLNEDALYSTIHGAGRLFSRQQAKKTFSKEDMLSWLKEKKVTLRGGDLDESPMAYKRIDDVLKQQGDTLSIEHVLTPIIVCMAGDMEVNNVQ